MYIIIMHCRIIFRPFQLFLLLEDALRHHAIPACLPVTVVQNLVWSNQLNVSHWRDDSAN